MLPESAQHIGVELTNISSSESTPSLLSTLHLSKSVKLAGSRYAYTRAFELPDPLLPTTFFVIRLDGKGFHGFSKAHDFDKPNDIKALELMNAAAKRTMDGKELMGECVIGFGESDEFR